MFFINFVMIKQGFVIKIRGVFFNFFFYMENAITLSSQCSEDYILNK